MGYINVYSCQCNHYSKDITHNININTCTCILINFYIKSFLILVSQRVLLAITLNSTIETVSLTASLN